MKFAAIADLPLKTGNSTYNANILYNIINDMIVNEKADAVLFPALNLTAPCSGNFLSHPQVQNDMDTAVAALKLVGMGDVLFTLSNLQFDAPVDSYHVITRCIHGGWDCCISEANYDINGSSDYAGILIKNSGREKSESLLFCPTAIPYHIASPKKLDEYAIERSKHTAATFLLINAGFLEFTSGPVYLPHIAMAKNGKLLTASINSSEPFIFDLDLPSFAECTIQAHKFPSIQRDYNSLRNSPMPFLEKNEDELLEIYEAMSSALTGRILSSHAEKLVIGVSGGLDSTLALLVACHATEPENVLAVSMPGFGTTSRTKCNAEKLCKKLKCEFRTIDITNACKQHFHDIGHDITVTDVVYENTQARERTQILMDLANQYNGLVVGTGDLSELALGWCTYNGDHMSMYAINSTVPKTLVRALISICAEKTKKISEILRDILDTPVSPELLPVKTKDKNSAQKTENILGAYELHDFYLFHFICLQEGPYQIFKAAKKVFKKQYPVMEIKRTLKLFFHRFFSQQFKRSCMPEGPQVTPVSLASHTGWYIPSDIDAQIWSEIMEQL